MYDMWGRGHAIEWNFLLGMNKGLKIGYRDKSGARTSRWLACIVLSF